MDSVSWLLVGLGTAMAAVGLYVWAHVSLTTPPGEPHDVKYVFGAGIVFALYGAGAKGSALSFLKTLFGG